MKQLALFFTLIFVYYFSEAQTLTPIDAGSRVHFVIKNFGIKVGGDFSGLQGAIVFNPASLATSSFNVSVKAATVDMDNTAMENHLRKADFFDAAKYPLLVFSSSKVTNSTQEGRFYIFGMLTIKGVTKPVEFGFSASPTPAGYSFKGDFELNRRDFGVGGNSFSISDKLKVSLEIAAAR